MRPNGVPWHFARNQRPCWAILAENLEQTPLHRPLQSDLVALVATDLPQPLRCDEEKDRLTDPPAGMEASGLEAVTNRMSGLCERAVMRR